MENQIVTIIKESGVVETQADIIQSNFNTYFEQAKEWEKKARAIVITSVDQVEEMKQAREARLFLKNIRCDAKNKHDELKEGSLRYGKAVDGVFNVLKALIEPTEEYLEHQEKFVERMESEAKEKVRQDREIALSPYIKDVSFYNLKDMSEAGYQELLNNSKTAYEMKIEIERAQEMDRIAREKVQAEEKAKMEIENKRLRAEAEEKDVQLLKLKAKAAADQKIIDDNFKLAQEATRKAEKELKDKKDAEDEKKRIEEENERLAELAPDKEKMRVWATAIQSVLDESPMIAIVDDEARAVISKAHFYLNEAIDKLTFKK